MAQIVVRRKEYTRADGTRVKATRYKMKNLGRKGKGPKLFTLRPGGLPGYHARNNSKTRAKTLRIILMTVPLTTVQRRLRALALLTKRTQPKLSKIYSRNARALHL